MLTIPCLSCRAFPEKPLAYARGSFDRTMTSRDRQGAVAGLYGIAAFSHSTNFF